MATSLQNTRLITPQDAGTIINIIAELEEMKDTYLVREKHRIGEYNTEKALEIVNNTEFLREIARSLDEEGQNKKKLQEVRSKTTEQIIKDIERSDRTNRILNAVIVGITALGIGLGVLFTKYKGLLQF